VRVCVDTNILVDILKDEWRPFQDMLYGALTAGETLVIPTVVYAELMPQFGGKTKQIDTFLQDHKIRTEPLELDAAVVAGSRWMHYLKRKTRLKCPECGHGLAVRKHVLSDFYIGGFALTRCQAVLTRDRSIYRTYFPELKGYKNCLD